MGDVGGEPTPRAGCLASTTWATTGVVAVAINILYAVLRFYVDPTPLWPTIAALVLLVVGVAVVALTADHPRAWVASTLYLVAVFAAAYLLLIPGRPLEGWFGE